MKMLTQPNFALAIIAGALTSTANASVVAFSDDFSGAVLDEAWNEQGVGGSLGNGFYQISNDRPDAGNGTKLRRNTDGSNGDLLSNIVVTLSNFSDPQTGSDFKWKFFGPDGFTELVLNSFGNMRMFHNDSDGGGGNIQPNTNLGLTGDGDVLELSLLYSQASDTLDVSYALNGGASTTYYSGGGIDGPVGNLWTNFVEVEVFEFGQDQPSPTIQIQEWNLGAIPEPSTSLLLVAGLGLFLRRRR